MLTPAYLYLKLQKLEACILNCGILLVQEIIQREIVVHNVLEIIWILHFFSPLAAHYVADPLITAISTVPLIKCSGSNCM